MSFYTIRARNIRKGVLEIFADYDCEENSDILIRGKAFYAVWNEEKNMWSTNERDVTRIVDADIRKFYEEFRDTRSEEIILRLLKNFSSGGWVDYRKFVTQSPDNSMQLDTKVTFLNQDVKKTDYVSKRLKYDLSTDDCPAFKEIINTLYDDDERKKLEWAIGSIFAGDSVNIQKFIVLYGEAGTGKSTILNIIQKLFDGYWTVFDAKALGSSSNTFSAEVFRDNPLVGIQHDGDLSKIEDNTKLNSIVSHEYIIVNEKYKSAYKAKANCMLFLGTNRPVKITDAKSGIIRRLITVTPTGNKININRYNALMSQIDFELGAIANYCLNVYRKMGIHYYDKYRPIDMMEKTDVFYNFVFDNYDTFREQDSTTLKQAYSLYKEYCDNSFMEFKMPMYKFREELKNYFKGFSNITRVNDKQVRSYYKGFCIDKFDSKENTKEETIALSLDYDKSLLDDILANQFAQYANEEDKPAYKWSNVTTTLKELDTTRTHFVRLPENHIVIDFDLKDENGEKSAPLNLEAANKWPQTYAEYSKGGAGIHLHYIYDGDVSRLSRIYSDGIEVKVFSGNASLRRRVSKCNNIAIAHISTGLPLKEEKPVVNFDNVYNERKLRALIEKNLKKEFHGYTAPSINFIEHLLNDYYISGQHYDVSDMASRILAFANNSTHQAEACVKAVKRMKFKSEEPSEGKDGDDEVITFFDVEVFPNLFLVNWKYDGSGDRCVRMINPSPRDIEDLFRHKLVGFNNRRYDNHILYARFLGYDNLQLYNLSQKLINTENKKNEAFFSEAYAISYTDIYDYMSAGNKMSLKKWEIKLGIHHQELGLPWDEPVPEDKWVEVAEYCDNDVIATEAVFHATKGDWTARQILAELSGLTVNDTTNQHTTRIIFGGNKKPNLIYTDLATGESYDKNGVLQEKRTDIITDFPGYEYKDGKNMFREVDLGRGGYVYANPGMYYDVALLDISSMHPHSATAMNCFGEYTQKFNDIMDARLYIKHKDYDSAKKMLDGKLAPYLDDPSTAKALSNALKTAINSVYGLTSATFDNPFRDPRNKNNIVALRGALFMKTLQDEVESRGFKVVHIKTDSIKIANATKDIIDFCMDFARKYGYEFEHEATYERICLVNDAVYIARYSEDTAPKDDDGNFVDNRWTATGAQFAHPYIFKTLFSGAPLEFEDYCETKSVKTAIYLDMNERLPEGDHNYIFVGRVGQFCPIKPGCGGGELVKTKDDKYYSVTGAKDWRWMESEVVKNNKLEDCINQEYFYELAKDAIDNISNYGDFEQFAFNENGVYPWTSAEQDDTPPWD